MAKVLAELQKGLASEEHVKFVQRVVWRLKSRRHKAKPTCVGFCVLF